MASPPTEAAEDSARLVQRQTPGSSGFASANSHAHDVIPPGNGEPLDEGTRGFMESRFRADFKDVRVHTDSQAAASADALRATAYTTGRDIYFAAGKYAPGSGDGQHRLRMSSLTLSSNQSAIRCSGKQEACGSADRMSPWSKRPR